MSEPTTLPAPSASTITVEEALRVAQADAVKAYRQVSHYRISIALEADGWHIEYRLKHPLHKGGGPHYVISDVTGEIVSKKYYQ